MLVKNKLMVGMADIKVAQDQAVYQCLGLGSCIGLCFIDPKSNVSGMVHIMLPEAFKHQEVEKPGKFADTGVSELLNQMLEAGAIKRRMVAAYAGGASVFQFGSGKQGLSSVKDIGSRNAEKVAELVDALGIPVLASDTGGSNGRSMVVCSVSGDVNVKTIREGEAILCNLRG